MSMPVTFEEFCEVALNEGYKIYPADTVNLGKAWDAWCRVRLKSNGCLTTRFNEYFERRYK